MSLEKPSFGTPDESERLAHWAKRSAQIRGAFVAMLGLVVVIILVGSIVSILEANSPVQNSLAECRFDVLLHGRTPPQALFRACMEAKGYVPDMRAPTKSSQNQGAQNKALEEERLALLAVLAAAGQGRSEEPEWYMPTKWRSRWYARLIGDWQR